jgi:branched-chain amino acid transport system ATP-binding protein
MLNVTGVSVYYGHIQAVRQVSLTVQQGEIVAILGPNGAGKSTLLRAITGQIKPSEGEILWQGHRLDGLSTHQVARAGLVLVPEGRQILPSMTVRDNLLLGGYRHEAGRLGELLRPVGGVWRKADLQERLATVFRYFPRLQERLGQRAGSLSGGEQQMLAIGRALMASPRLLLLDEPSIGLAPNLVREILQLLLRLREEGLTLLLVEQDAHAALRIADRGYVLETGRVVAEGSARELLNSERMRRAYLGMV